MYKNIEDVFKQPQKKKKRTTNQKGNIDKERTDGVELATFVRIIQSTVNA